MYITEAKKEKVFKERGELPIVSNILRSPADNVSVGFGDLEAMTTVMEACSTSWEWKP